MFKIKGMVLFSALLTACLFVSCKMQLDPEANKMEMYKNVLNSLSFDLVYNANGGTGTMPVSSHSLGDEVTISSSSFIPPVGMRFNRWNTEENGEGETYNPDDKLVIDSADVNLYAIWIDKDAHSIIYNNTKNLPNENPYSFYESKKIVLKPLTREGYEFLGWYTNLNYTGNPVSGWEPGTYTSDLVFYARWKSLSPNHFDIDNEGISNLHQWLLDNLDTSKTDNKLMISGDATTNDLRTLSTEIKAKSQYIEELDLSDLNVTQFYNSNWGASREYGFMSGLTNVKKIILPASLKILSEGAFSYCDNLEEIVINEGVTDMLWSAFSNCTKLKEVTIPDSVEFLAQTVFYHCTSLEKVNISKNSNLEILGLSLFRHCTKLTEFYFPSKVVLLDSRAATRSRGNAQSNANNNGSFLECTGLTTLTFSKNIKKINNRVFEGCNKITTINFEGTPEEWAAVQIGSNNGSLLSATVNYNYVIQ